MTDVYSITVTRRELKKLARDLANPVSIAARLGGEKALKAIERRVVNQQTDPHGRKLAPLKVRVEKKRPRWEKKTADEGGRAQPRRNQTPASVFQIIRELGGVIYTKREYEFERVKGGRPIHYGNDAGPELRQKIWGYRWDTAEEFKSDNGARRFTKRSGRTWKKTKVGVIPARGNQPAQLVLKFTGRSPKNRPAHLLAIDMNGRRTKTGRKSKPSAAEIMGVANSRDRHGNIGRQPRGGAPGEKVRIQAIPDTSAVRWYDLSDGEVKQTLLAALDDQMAGAWDNMNVQIVEAK